MSARARRWETKTAVGALALALASCSNAKSTATAGGQSGTEADGLPACLPMDPRPVAPDEVLPELQLSLRDITPRLAVELPGTWLATGTRPTLSIDVSSDSALERMARNLCSPVVDVDTTVRSSDGALAARVRAELQRIGPGFGLTATLPGLAASYLGPAVWPLDETAARGWLNGEDLGTLGNELILHVDYRWGDSPVNVYAVIADAEYVAGAWSANESDPIASGPPYSYMPDPVLADACVGAEQYRENRTAVFSPSLSPDPVVSSVVGTWARCLDAMPSRNVGLQILADGSWHDLTLENGQLVAGTGFEHEGFVDILKAGPLNATSALYQVDLLPAGRRSDSQVGAGLGDIAADAWGQALLFSSEFSDYPDAVYLQTSLPVRTPPPEYSEGARGGADACSHSEQSIVPTLAESESFLSGDFVLCSGSLGSGATRLHFESPNIELQRDDGSVIARQRWRVDAMNAPRLSIELQVDDSSSDYWVITVSRRPLKLSIQNYEYAAVFSALP